ncbi:unnamed protein product, partial [Mesorhabditis belari]|uniref:Uncharacterized protein n=1 Tax=Mesorhabditis belari TaxID=2138241 RepID=A0AAF3FGN9_9BILA
MSADKIEKLRLLGGDKVFWKSILYKPCYFRDDRINTLPIHKRREYEQRNGLRLIITRDGQRRREVIPGGAQDRDWRAHEERERQLVVVNEKLSHYIDYINTLLGKYP